MSKKGYLEDFECLNEVQIDSPPADRLQKIGCSFVDIHATELGFMSKDGKLRWQSFDIRLRSVARILMELCLFFCGIYLPAITHFCFQP